MFSSFKYESSTRSMLPKLRSSTFDKLFGDFFSTELKETEFMESMFSGSKVETIKNGSYVEIDLPGVEKDDLKVELDKGHIRITSTRDGNLAERALYVGKNVEPKHITSKLVNGVLSIHVDGVEDSAKSEIKVE